MDMILDKMIDKDIDIFIERDFRSHSVEVWATGFSKDGGRFNYSIGEKGILIRTALEVASSNNDLLPLLKLPEAFSDILLKAFAEHLDSRGIKVRSVHEMEGELKTIKRHLEDMRALVFKDSVPPKGNE
jgi:hypothetical protein